MLQDLDDPAESFMTDMLHEANSLDALDEDEDKERRRKIIKYIVSAVLSYHVIPQPFDVLALAKNSTHGTNLTLPDGSLDGKPLRVRVGRAPFSPALTINLFSRVEGPEIVTSNGIIHAISLPLLPPPAIFTGQFNLPSVFSIAVSLPDSSERPHQCLYVYRPRRCSVLVLPMRSTSPTVHLTMMTTRVGPWALVQSRSLLRQTTHSSACQPGFASSYSRRSATEPSRSSSSTTSYHRTPFTRVCRLCS
jgi:hypothetical protein